jgi:hypothetical protein
MMNVMLNIVQRTQCLNEYLRGGETIYRRLLPKEMIIDQEQLLGAQISEDKYLIALIC